jgi:serine/threonine protein kinase
MQGVLSVERRREVESHIDGCASCSSLVVGVGRTFERGVDLPLQGKLGRYELVEQLGRGAMGSVYSARDPLLAREVALKILHKNAGNLDEARALARLAHPNVVAVYDVGEEDGRVWIAMERASGETLGAWLRSTTRSWEAILGVFVQAARALDAAHAAGVVHGDFKPDNVLVAPDGSVKVMDFGLARLHDAIANDDRLLAGTPAYMAPEQLEGGAATPASDQFAFATTLHEALYGARAYAAPTMTELREQMRNARVLQRPAHARGVPDWVFPIVARGVEIDPRFRFSSMKDLARSVTRRLGGDVHYKVNAALQIIMWIFHVAITTLFLIAITSDAEPQRTYPPDEARLHYISTVIAVWLAALFFFGWAPLGIFWTPINAYGLLRRRRWALGSTMIYAGYSLWTCIGTPFAIYTLLSLWPLRKNKNATSP